MTIADFISDLARRRIELTLENGRLRYRAAAAALGPDILSAIRERREDIVAYLANGDTADAYPEAAGREFNLSEGQAALWFIHEFDRAGLAYNLALAAWLTPDLDATLLRAALADLTLRHPALATQFAVVDGSPRQRVGTSGRGGLDVADMNAWAGEQIERLVAECADLPFDLDGGPLARWHLVTGLERDGTPAPLLIFAAHHSIVDFRSLEILARDLSRLYASHREGSPPDLPLLSWDYRDYVGWSRAWRDSPQGLAARTYWLRELDGELPILDLPTDRPRPPQQSYAGAVVCTTLDSDVSAELKAFARHHNATPFAVLLTALGVLLRRYSGQDDILIGVPMLGRGRSELADMVGYFVNSVVLRLRFAEDMTARSLVEVVRERALAGLAHQDYPFPLLVAELQPQRDPSRSPLFQVAFVYERDTEAPIEGQGLFTEIVWGGQRGAAFDLTLTGRDRGDRFELTWEYATALFDETTVTRMDAHFNQLLRSLLGEPEQPVDRLPMLTARDEAELASWSGASNLPAATGAAGTVIELFDAQLRRTPDAIAIEAGDESLTYRALAEAAAAVAGRLRRAGVAPGTVCAIDLPRSAERLIGLLGILRAGGACLPLDPEHPADRLAFMLAESEAIAVLTDESHAARLPKHPAATVLISDCEGQTAFDDPAAGPDDLLYILYTSGSTGRPKGVAMPNRALVNLIAWQSGDPSLAKPRRVAQYQPLTFDVAFQEIASTLCTGGTLVMADEEVRHDSIALLDWIGHRRIERLFVPFVALQHLAESGGRGGVPASLRDIVTAGEQLRITSAIRQFLAAGTCRLHNHYGPTETHVVTAHCLTGDPAGWEDLPPIGTPIDGVAIHLLDRHGAPVPPGVPGELCVSGAALAHGYIAQPLRTAERFVAHPTFGRIYRTGDLALWRADSRLAFLGRRDDQIKLRGFRVELGEIEAVLLGLPAVREAAVLVHGEGDRRRLAAFVSPAAGTDGPGRAALREAALAHLRSRLPAYMVPASLTVLDSLPTNASGKIDRRALVPPELGADLAHAVPAGETERLLALLWSDLLDLPAVGATADFFALGGHSLLAMRLIARIRGTFGIELPVRALFENPTVAGVARLIEARQGLAVLPPIVPAGEGTAPPLSFAQQRLWFLDQFEGPSATYNLAAALDLRGPLDREALRRALRRLVERHQALRHCFPVVDGRPMIRELAAYDPLDVTDLGSHPDSERDAEADHLAAVHASQPFDLAHGPLLRLHLLRLGDDHHRLLFNLHHIVGDGWSLGVLLRDLDALYLAARDGGVERLPALPAQYADYAAWERNWLTGDVLAQQLGYWESRLANPPPLLELPTDRPRPARRTYRGGLVTQRLDRATVAALRRFNRARGATSFMTLLAAFKLLLARHVGQSDIAVGSPVANRRHHATDGVIGLFVNTLVLRSRIDDETGFAGFVEQVRQTCLDAYGHQDLPFDHLVEALQPERSLSHSPLFQVMFVQQDALDDEVRLTGLAAQRLAAPLTVAKFDLTVYVEDAGDEIRLGWEYNADLFDATRIERLAGHFARLLAGGLDTPDRPVATLDPLTEPERRTILSWSSGLARPAGMLLTDAISAQVARTPHHVAVQAAAETLRYAELERRANQLAHHLRGRRVGPGSTVALCLPRGPDMVVAILAVLKAGAAYLPLDPSYPAARLAFILQDAACDLLVTQAALHARLPEAQHETCCLDLEADAIAEHPAEPPMPGPGPDDRAYVIYTSGSTGQPKGAAVTHRGLTNLLAWYVRTLDLSERDRVLLISALGFDLTQKNVFAPLLVGASLHLPDDDAFDPDALVAAIARQGITWLNSTPSAFAPLLECQESRGFGALASLRWVVLGGEPIPLARLRPWLDAPACGARVLNTYGPTECTDIATAWCLDGASSDDPVPLGRPIDNVRVALLDARRRLVPAGIPGELWIGGAGVGAGYLNRAALNADAFAVLDLGDGPRRMYRTGDRAVWRAEGVVDYLGRADDQVKLRGFRIELGEVAAALRAQAGVRDAVAVVHDGTGSDRLIGYVVTDTAQVLDRLDAALRERLPDYMVPAQLVRLDRIPLTPNGKLDRGSLPPPEASAIRDSAQPLTGTEARIAELWAGLLGLDRIDRDANFFQIGGHSLLATQVIARVSAAFAVDLPLRALFEAPTVAGLAAQVEAARERRLPPLVPQPYGAALPLSFSQQRLWFLDRLDAGSTAYNMPAVLELDGALDVAALRRALADLVVRHSSLRMCFPTEGGEPRVRLIDPYDPLTVTDLSASDDPVGQVEALWASHAARPFSLDDGPLFDLHLLSFTPRRHRLLFNMHHIISDGWSIDVLIRELAALYHAHRHGVAADLPPLAIQYTDYAAWQRDWLRGEALEAQIAHWRDALADAPERLELPTDFPRPAVLQHRGGDVRFVLDAALVGQIQTLARSGAATPFMVLLAAFTLLLQRASGQSDICVGVPVANRPHRLTEDVVGLFLNTLVLRLRNAGQPSFRALLAEVRNVALAAYANQDVPFELLVERLQPHRSLSHNPLFQVLLNLVNTRNETVRLDELDITPLGSPQGLLAKFDLSLALTEMADGTLDGRLEYNAELFIPETAAFLAECFVALLREIVHRPDAPLHELSCLADAYRVRAASAKQVGPATPPVTFGTIEESVPQRFARQVARFGDRVAVRSGSRTLTYRALADAAHTVAAAIAGAACAPRIGLLLAHDERMAVGILGSLMAGRTYVPLDSAHPEERLAFILDDIGADCVLCSAEFAPLARRVAGADRIVLDLDDLEGTPTAEPLPSAADTVAYILYTSGSTGRPKGVMQSHRNVLHFIREYTEALHITPEDRLLQVASYAFDAAVMDFFGALLNGAALCLADIRAGGVGEAAAAIGRELATIVHATPTVFRLLASEDWEPPASVRLVVLGGEAVGRDDVAACRRKFGPACLFVNGLGPTESTVTLQHFVGNETELPRMAVPVGCPVGGTEVLLVDEAGGETELFGEIVVCSAHVALGYWRQDSSSFRDDPAHPGRRLYRSGDLARRLPDGSLEVVGRRDGQVKLRGMRIELGEIEAVLRRHPKVREAGVVLWSPPTGGDQRLVAYVAGDAVPAELRDFAAQTLPNYMVPSAIALLPALPVTVSGKLDRRSLPAPAMEGDPGTARRAPASAAETVLADVWSELLGVPVADVDTDFFDAGGHSLMAMQVVARVRERLGVALELRTLFEHPTLGGLAHQVEGSLRGAALPELRPLPAGVAPPLSFAQQRLWFLARLQAAAGAAYTIGAALELRGALDEAALRRALRALTARQQSLRMNVAAPDSEPVLRLREPYDPLELAEETPADEAALLASVSAALGAPFDLEHDALMRLKLWRLGPDRLGVERWVLGFAIHHIIADGWSLDVLVRELSALYAAELAETPASLAPLAVQYGDYAAWQRDWLSGAERARQLAHWRDALAGMPALLELPGDHPRPAARSYRGGQHQQVLDAALVGRLTALGRRHGATLFMTLLAAFDVLLARWSGSGDIAVGSPVANRAHSRSEALVGLFVNTLVLRVQLDLDQPFEALLGTVRRTALAAYAHQDLPFEVLVSELQPQRSLGHSPLFQVMFALQNAPLGAVSLPGLAVRPLALATVTAKFDLVVSLSETAAGDLAAVWEYSTDLFEAATVARLAGHYATLLESVLAAPGVPVGTLEMLTGAERRALAGWNATARPLPEQGLAALFAAQVAAAPDAPALRDDAGTLSYAALAAVAERLARLVARRLGTAAPGEAADEAPVAGLCLGRGRGMITAMLAVLQAGAAYLPLDPAEPAERLAFMLAEADAALVLVDGDSGAALPPACPRLDIADAEMETDVAAPLPVVPGGDRLAYVMFTSGSTGRPKAVEIPHRAVVRLVCNTDYVRFGPGQVIAQASTPLFDAATFEVWGALLNGAVLRLLGRDDVLDPDRLSALLRGGALSTLFLTTPLFNRLAQLDPAMFADLDLLVVGGDVIDPVAARAVRTTAPPRRLVNGYGPTEATTFAICHEIGEVAAEAASVPIGRPIANTVIHLLDAAGGEVPVGVTGEIHIGGPGLARGYRNRPELTEERFFVHPTLGRLYRTGDLARRHADGVIEFLGRRDQQIKLRGFRIEPGEIEAQLRRQPGIAEALVRRHEVNGEPSLVAWIVPRTSDADLDIADVRARLRRALPDHMVPAHLIALAAFPFTANGKIDTALLPEPGTTEPRAEPARAVALTPTEELLAGLWSEVLPAQSFGRDTNFFDAGGHSLMAMQLVARVRALFDIELPLEDIFAAPSLGEMAARVEISRGSVAQAIPIPRLDRSQTLPLSFAQQRLWFLSQLEPNNPFYNTPLALRIAGPLHPDALCGALQDLIARHEGLRTAFPSEDGRPRQMIADTLEITVRRHDLSSLPETEREAALIAQAEAEARTPFGDLSALPLIRAVLIRLGEEEHALLLTIHHLVTDGWSIGLLAGELAQFYRARVAGTPVTLPTLDIQYADFAAWQRGWLQGETLAAQLDYWRRQLEGAPPALALPTDRPRPAVQEFRGASLRFTLDAPTRDALHKLGRRHDATLFMTLLAGLAVVLYRYSGQDDIIIGSPIANRQRPELEKLFGFFVNTLALRVDLAGAPSFAALLRRVQLVALGAYAHQDMPFEHLVDELQPERDLSRSPLFQVMCALQNMPLEEIALDALRLSSIHVQRRAALFDLVLDFWDLPDGLHGVLEYNSDLFDEATAAQMMGHLARVLAAVAKDPDQTIDRLPLLDAAERRDMLAFVNGPAIDHPVHRSLAATFEERVRATPERVAASAGEHAVTYGALNLRANRIAHLLRDIGIGCNDVVGLLLPRGPDYLAALLGTVKAGAAFLPLDTGYPAERLRYMAADAGLRVLIATGADAAALTADGELPGLTDIVLLDGEMARTGIHVHANEAIFRQPGGDPPLANGPRDNLYLLYTSGSTGLPKGTLVRHDGALNHIHAEARLLDLGEGTAFLQSAPASSDISVWQCLAPLLLGGRVVFVDFATTCSPPDLFALMAREQVTLIELVPMVLEGLLNHAASLPASARALPALRCAMVTGETVSVTLANRWFEIWPEIPLVNAYGPSEAADDVSQHMLRAPLPAASGSVPIGTPVDNMSIFVLDSAGDMQPVGVPGEICVSGIGVGAGYWRQPERTAAAFVPNRHAGATYGETTYRTGDLGRWRRDGTLEFIGRLDHQVKIRGFRVELGEIEAALAGHPEMRDVVVIDHLDTRGERRLAAYVRPHDDAQPSAALSGEQVSRWKDLHETSYADTGVLERTPTFNTIGWDSTYTGEPLSREEMEEAVGNAVDRILALALRRLLEIGCGTGLLLHRLMPGCEHYLGTDLSAVAIRQLEAARGRTSLPGPERMQLKVQPAHDFADIAPGAFDTIVLNSVVQYFPDADYLVAVLREAVARCADGGAVFVGDVRNLATLRAYHASVQLYKADDAVTRDEMTARIDAALAREQELAVAPALFMSLADATPRVASVEIRPKRGRIANEMTQFRYDVVLHVGNPGRHSAPAAVEHDWRSAPLAIDDIAAHLEHAAPDEYVIRHVANGRLSRERLLEAWLLRDTPSETTVAKLRQSGARAVADGLDPETIWALCDRLPYAIDIRIEPNDPDGAFAVCFTRRGVAGPASVSWASSPGGSDSWRSFTNDPLRQSRERRLVQQLRAHLKATLPGHMIPASFVVLQAFPLAPSGKIDRAALPAPDLTEEQGDRTAPRTRTEQTLQSIWGQVLGVEQPGIHANFFALGGHSLRVTQIVSRVGEDIGIGISLRDVFTWPTIAELAAFIDRSTDQASRPSIPSVDPALHYPVSHAQQRLWVLHQMGAASAYHMAAAWRLRGPLRPDALERAVAELHRRHEVLRTGFVEIDGELRQVVADTVAPAFRGIDLSGEPDPLAAVRAHALLHAGEPIDLARPPLLRIDLLRLSADEHVVLFAMHHIISDGWSLDVLAQELVALYGGASSGGASALPPLAVQHRDFVAWQRKRLERDGAQHQAYWLAQLGDRPTPLDLPTDFVRPAVKTYRGGAQRLLLPPLLLRALEQLARREEASLFMVLLALVNVLLFRISGDGDISVGSPVAGRDHPDLERQIGLFVNTLVLRSQIAGDQEFVVFLRSIRDRATGWYAHQEYPFDLLVQDINPPRDPSRNPLFDVMVALQNTSNTRLELPDIAIDALEAEDTVTQFDLLWSFAPDTDGLHLSLRYNADLFRPETIERLTQCWRVLAEASVANPQTPVSRLPLLTAEERAALLRVPPPPDGMAPEHASIVRSFEAQAAAAPDAVAVTDGERTLTYAELNGRANALARRIRAHLAGSGGADERLVAICMSRSVDQVVAILGVLKAGAAYLPLDPDAPAARLGFIMNDAAAALLLTRGENVVVEGRPLPPQWSLEDVSPPADEGANLDLPIDPDRAAYVIYTSGSTGEPKGAVITHGNVLRLFSATRPWFAFGPDDVWTLFHSIAFDFAVWEMFGALLHGGRLVVVPYLVSRAPDQFHELLRRERVTVLNQTPSAFLQLQAHDATAARKLPDLRTVIFGGEALDTASLADWFAGYGSARPQLVNMYGITETTVHVTHRRLHAKDAQQAGSPIGAPIPDLYLRVLDPTMEPVPACVAGELYVGGAGLARGYLGRPELTAERFIDDPFQPGARLYRTGDRVRRRADGELEFVGRLDDQVKIRGFRIEPGEVAAVLNRHPSVAHGLVTVLHRFGQAEMVAYYVGRDGAPGEAELRRHLQAELPAYMIPRWFVPLERLPLTINGKLDYRALPEPGQSAPARTDAPRAASSALEQEIVETWRRALDHSLLDPDDNVFDHGAHSVLVVRVRGELQRALSREIPVIALFQYPTAATLARHLGSGQERMGQSADATDRAMQRRQAARGPSTRRAARETTK